LCVMGIVVTILLVEPIYKKWRTSPTYISIGHTSHPIWNVDFPAVTICTNNRISMGQLEWTVEEEE